MRGIGPVWIEGRCEPSASVRSVPYCLKHLRSTSTARLQLPLLFVFDFFFFSFLLLSSRATSAFFSSEPFPFFYRAIILVHALDDLVLLPLFPSTYSIKASLNTTHPIQGKGSRTRLLENGHDARLDVMNKSASKKPFNWEDYECGRSPRSGSNASRSSIDSHVQFDEPSPSATSGRLNVPRNNGNASPSHGDLHELHPRRYASLVQHLVKGISNRAALTDPLS